MWYLRSYDQTPSLKNDGACFISLAASVACLSSHLRPSARKNPAIVGSALILSSRKTLASNALVLMVASGLGSAASDGGHWATAAKSARAMAAHRAIPVSMFA